MKNTQRQREDKLLNSEGYFIADIVPDSVLDRFGVEITRKDALRRIIAPAAAVLAIPIQTTQP